MTRRQHRRRRQAERVLEALIKTGSYKAAADMIGISEDTARRRMTEYLQQHRFVAWGQAAYYYGRPEPEHLPGDRL